MTEKEFHQRVIRMAVRAITEAAKGMPDNESISDDYTLTEEEMSAVVPEALRVFNVRCTVKDIADFVSNHETQNKR